MDPETLSAQQRAALALWAIVQGEKLTAGELAPRLGISASGAQSLLNMLSRVTPILQAHHGGPWIVCDDSRPAFRGVLPPPRP